MSILNVIEGAKPKCHFTSTILPFVDHDHVPTKRKPFSTVLGQTFNDTLDVVLPEEAGNSLRHALPSGKGVLEYQTVYMKLSDLIDGEFFNLYIKTGNILMVSEGRPGIDHVFSLDEGILRLEVDEPTFERLGLDGNAISSKGRKHVKARYAIDLNLRLPSMVRGKSGFERIVWAFKNVLNRSLLWLFYDLKGLNDGWGPIAIHQPKLKKREPQIEILDSMQVPDLSEILDEDGSGRATEILEWLSLTASGSPRVQQHDQIDPYLSRFPVLFTPDTSSDTVKGSVQNLVKFRWNGFMPPTFIQTILLASLKASGDNWFAFKATSLDGKAYAFLHRHHHTMTWEYVN